MSRPNEDWAAVLQRVLDDDPLALLQVSRLLTSYLARWNAYDFHSDWEDLIQESIIAGMKAVREGKLRDREAALGYLRSTMRFKFVDRLKTHLKYKLLDPIPWEEATEEPIAEAGAEDRAELARDLRNALDVLPERERQAVIAVHVQGLTYDEAASSTGIPLGTLKRALRTGLAQLRRILADSERPP